MKLASYRFRGRESYGAVSGDGIVELKSRMPKYPTLLDVLRGDALAEAAACMHNVRPDVPLAEVELLPPLHAPEKILCIGINYANRNKDYDIADVPTYPSMFYRAPTSLVGSGQSLLIPVESEQLDYEGEIALVIGKGGRRIAVLGDMLELGEFGARLHAELAEPVDAAGVDVLYAAGPLMAHLWAHVPEARKGAYGGSSEELRGPLLAGLRAGDAVMIKGSLGSRMGPLVDAIRAAHPPKPKDS